MMKNKFFGINAKVFSYTILILVIVIIVAATSFSNQISAMLESMERHQLTGIFAPLVAELAGSSEDEIYMTAEIFHQKNESVEFGVQTAEGRIVYITENAGVLNVDANQDIIPVKTIKWNMKDFQPGVNTGAVFHMTEPLPNGASIHMSRVSYSEAVYNDFVLRTVIVIIMLFLIGTLCAALFAYRFTKPIRTLAMDTRRMADLEFVPPPVARKDEIGQLAKDVYEMYEGLKTEIEREREMEESQRYFFSAASHELKTPIASALILLQGMHDNVGEYKDHRKYLHECIKKLTTQSKMISEILDIVSLSDGRIIPSFEKTELAELVFSVIVSHQTIAESKGLNITDDIPSEVFIKTDCNMLSRVLSNVILNAIQNTPENGEIRIFLEEKDDEVIRLIVQNKGVSIDEATLLKAFQPFYREDEARSSGQERSGLGLAIVKKTLDCMEIPFSLESKEDSVSFWMDLPTYSS